MADFHKAAKDAQKLHELQATNRKLLRLLDQAKTSKQELVDAVYRAAKDAAEQIDLPTVAAPPKERKKSDGTPETAILVVSDWQLGKKTPSYNSNVCAQRVAKYSQRVRRLTDIQRADRPIRKARIFLLGDLCEGELIFPGQEHRIDASLFRQVMLDGPEILGTMVRDALNYFDVVEVDEVIGNHGALGGPGRKSYHPESNADAMLYEATRKMLGKEKRLIWNTNYQPGERAWYKVIQIGQHGYFVFHGDQMRGGGFAGIPIYGFVRAINNWASGVIPEPFSYALCGHWHQLWSMAVNSRILWINGSTESDNTWVREELKAQANPGQWLLFAHDRRGVTSEHRVWLS